MNVNNELWVSEGVCVCALVAINVKSHRFYFNWYNILPFGFTDSD